MTAKWRVVIADDHAITRQGIRVMAENAADVEVVAEAQNGVEAVQLTDRLEPNLVFMDLRMPEMDGVEAIKEIKASHPGTKILVLSVEEDEERIFEAINAGAAGYLSKSSRLEELRVIFRGLDEDGVQLTPSIARKVVGTVTGKSAHKDHLDLTPREQAVVDLLGRGYSARKIASQLGIRVGTVNTHIGNVYRKLGVNNRVDAVREAMRLRIIARPD